VPLAPDVLNLIEQGGLCDPVPVIDGDFVAETNMSPQRRSMLLVPPMISTHVTMVSP
jgi:hypothetical protein